MPAVTPEGVQSIGPTTETCCGFIVGGSRAGLFHSAQIKTGIFMSDVIEDTLVSFPIIGYEST